MADWVAIRLGLRAVRKERKMTLRWLHGKTGISPSTVNRIERVGKYPAHKPDLETLAALVGAIGLTLSQFFARIEKGLNVAASGDTDHIDPHDKATNHGPAISAEHANIDRAYLFALGEILVAAFDRSISRLLAARTETRTTPRAASARRRTRRKMG